jgi:hypothetical protein
MKRCPECDSVFPDSNRFCDLDGTPLEEDEEISDPPADEPAPSNSWKLLAMGGVAGLALGVILFVIYYALIRQEQPPESRASVNASIIPQPPPLLRAEPVTNPSPSPEPSPSPSPTASPSPSPKPSPTVKLSSSPVSTGIAASTRVTIRLRNGASIDADEAWQGKEGIWYRQRGVVALLDPAQIKSIDRPAPEPSPSPSASPSP